MGDDAPRVDPGPSDEERSHDLLDVAEQRRQQADGFAWTVPGLALAAQALLLTIALDASTSPWDRIGISLFGLVIVFAAAHFLAKQVHNFDLYESVIEDERIRLGLLGVHRDALIERLDLAASLDDRRVARQYRRRWARGWNDDGTIKLRWPVRFRAVWTWFLALGAMVVIDAVLIVLAVRDLR